MPPYFDIRHSSFDIRHCFHFTVRLAFIGALIMFSGCSESEQPQTNPYTTLTGNAQGTTFRITFQDTTGTDYTQAVQDLLQEIDRSVSTYVDSSTISRFNSADTISVADEHFFFNLELSRMVHHYSSGAFEPTVMPLVRAWGFGPNGRPEADTTQVAALLPFVGLKHIHNTPDITRVTNMASTPLTVWKDTTGVQLDFNAVAQGYSVDVLFRYFRNQGIRNVMVEIGGEVRAMGQNPEGGPWRIGIDKPEAGNDDRELAAVIQLNNKALATSGNYRKFYELGGKKFSHTINPKTGRPVQHGLLSATVLASDCASADAYATAFMVLGVEGTKKVLEDHPSLGLEVFLVYSEEGKVKTHLSKGFPEME